MILFYLINIIFKCCFRFELCCFKAVLHTKRIIVFVKGCSNFSNKELWWKLDWYFINNSSSFWEAWCCWVESNQFFFNMFWFVGRLLITLVIIALFISWKVLSCVLTSVYFQIMINLFFHRKHYFSVMHFFDVIYYLTP